MPKFPELVTALIETLSHEGRGIAHIAGRTVFVSGGLPGETVQLRYLSQRKKTAEAVAVSISHPSPQRVAPACPHFGVCGGCNLQHVSPTAQLQLKQAMVLEQLTHMGHVQPAQIAPPLQGDIWGYRRKARLGVKYVTKKETVLVGFREQNSHLIAELTSCLVLHSSVGERLSDLRTVVNQLEARDKIAQIEVAVGDNHTALVFRHLIPLSANDCTLLSEFAQNCNMYVYLQSGGLDSITPLYPADAPLASLIYALPAELSIQFAPHDFTQVNHSINSAMINQALTWLDLQPDDNVLELFCGLGNFTLPLAQRVKQVVAIEGDASLLARARDNASAQHIDNISYYAANLADMSLQQPWLHQPYEKVLLDPPRSGALEIIKMLPFNQVKRIVYVSCNPATLARDAGELVQQKSYDLAQIGIIDMFPHTAHVETMALFTK